MNNEEKNNIDAGNRVRDLRGTRTQVEMASVAGVTQGQWSKFEKGMIPKIEVASKIAKALEVTVDYLCHGEAKNKFKQFTNETQHHTLCEIKEDYPHLANELPRMAVTEVKRQVSDDGWELLDYYEVMCDEQKRSLLGVARAMAAGVPVKSRKNGESVSNFPEKKSA